MQVWLSFTFYVKYFGRLKLALSAFVIFLVFYFFACASQFYAKRIIHYYVNLTQFKKKNFCHRYCNQFLVYIMSLEIKSTTEINKRENLKIKSYIGFKRKNKHFQSQT